MEETKTQIRDLLSLGRTEEALEHLKKINPNQASLLLQMLDNSKKQYNMGFMDFSNWSRTQAQIKYAALEIMKELRIYLRALENGKREILWVDADGQPIQCWYELTGAINVVRDNVDAGKLFKEFINSFEEISNEECMNLILINKNHG